MKANHLRSKSTRRRAERLQRTDALLSEGVTKLDEMRRERDRARGALIRIATSVALVLASKAVPVKIIPGLQAIESEAREYSK